MLGELTSKIKLHQQPMSINEALNRPRLVRKNLEVPLVFRGDDPLLIGRDERSVTLVINDPFISRNHAAILQDKTEFFLQDLNSKNGTYLNDTRLHPGEKTECALKHGDRLRFNNVEFEFIIPEESV